MKVTNKSLASSLLLGTAIAALPLFAVSAQAQDQAATANSVEQVTVTGTIIRGAGPTGSNLITVNRQSIEDIGAVTVSQVLADIPGLNNFGSAGQGGQNSSDPGGASSPTIHNLGSSASNGTLILVDSHRLPYTGIQHNTIDPSAIPVIALQQVVVLPDGASATYGSDAVAGVLNFITRKNFTGLEAQAQYGFADNYSNFSAGGIAGHDWGSGSALIAYEYTSKGQLANGVRSYETARQDLRLGVLANPAAFAPALATTPPVGFQTTTPDATHGTTGPFSVTVPYPSAGSNLQGFSCPIATEKANAANGTTFLYPYTTTTGIVSNISQINGVCDENSYGTQLPSETRNTIFISLKQELTDDISITADFDYSTRFEGQTNSRSNITATVFGPTSGKGGTGVGGTTSSTAGTVIPVTGITTTNPLNQINPFYNAGTTGIGTTSMLISFDPTQLLAGQPKTEEKTGDTVAFTTLGLDWDLGHDWVYSIGGTFGVDFDFDRTRNSVCTSCADLALNGTTNSAGTPNNTPASTAAPDPAGLGTIISEDRALTTANALDVWDPAGPTNKTSAAVLKQLVSGFSNTTATQGIQDVSTQIGGPAFDLPAGPVKVAIGGEFIHTTDAQLQNTTGALAPASVASNTVNLFYGRTVWAAYAEILAPLVSPEMNIPLVQKFTLDMSGRIDQYTSYGFTKNPKVGFIWQIVDGLQGRGSYGTSFTVPAFASGGSGQSGVTSQSAISTGGAPGTPVNFNDTLYNGGAGVAGTWVGSAATCFAAGSQPVDANGNNISAAPFTGATACKINTGADQGLQYAAGGKPGLKPEIGTTYSGGFDFDFGKFADVLDGLTGEATYFQAKYAGLVTSIGIQQAQEGLTTFAPAVGSGGATGGWAPTDPAVQNFLAVGYPLNNPLPSTIWYLFDGRQTNAYTLWENGIDYGIHYTYNSDLGVFSGGITGTEIIRFTQENEGANQPLIDIKNGKALGAGRFAGQENTWRATLDWNQNPYRLGFGFNFQSPYLTSVNSFPYNLAGPGRLAGSEKISALFTIDLNAGYTIPDDWYPGIGGSQINLSVSNLLDQNPPFQDSASGMAAGSQLGRLFNISLKKTF